MKIGIDARMYGPKQAGLGRYVQELVLGLAKIDKENEYVIFLKSNNFHELDITNNINFKKVLVDISWYSLKEQVKFRGIIGKERVDLMHFPHWNVPLFYNNPFVVTIHDLIMYHYPRQEASMHGPIIYWFKDMMHRLVLHHAVKKARHIIVTSEFTKQDIHKTLKVPMEKMTVIYQAPLKLQNAECRMQNGDLGKFGISKKYVLYVGNAYPHKNLEGLLRAWKIFCERYGDGYQLVLVGKKNFFYNKLLCHCEERSDEAISGIGVRLSHQPLEGLPRNDRVVFTDFVSDAELTTLYQNASLYVFPSLYEGFGLPPLEAMIHGVPVVSSNTSCLPEVLGEAALYFDPENYEQMAEVIYKGLTDENIRMELRERAKGELKRYSGEKFVKKILEIYLK